MLALSLALILSGGPAIRATGSGKAITFPRKTCSKSIDCAIQAGDKAGNWWALKANGTMLTGSALTQTPTGSPGVSPLTFDGATQFYSSGNVAFPTGNFSVVAVVQSATINVAQQTLIGDFVTFNKFLFRLTGTGGSMNLTVWNSTAGTTIASIAGAEPAANTWFGACGMYTSSTGTAVIRSGGTTSSGGASGGTGVQAGSSAHFAAAASAVPLTPLGGLARGFFFTEKVISDADCDRIIAGGM